MYKFAIGEDDEVMRSSCASLFVSVENYLFA
jgi:hypothetical protein